MLKVKSIAGILLLSVILSGCQNNNVTSFTDATRIEVLIMGIPLNLLRPLKMRN